MQFKANRILWTLLVCFGLALTPSQGRADEYAKPSLSNIYKTMLRFGALDIHLDKVVDYYARTTECAMFKQNYSDDFKWQAIRGKLRETIRQNIATYPIAYQYDAVLQLDRYDFKKGVFRFTDRTAQSQTNVFTMVVHRSDYCIEEDSDVLPNDYRMVLDSPIHMEGLPLTTEDGDKLLKRMVANNNADRLVYARFNIRIVYIAPIKLGRDENKGSRKEITPISPMVTQTVQNASLGFDARLDSIDYYEDQARTRLIYTYRP